MFNEILMMVSEGKDLNVILDAFVLDCLLWFFLGFFFEGI